ncbi:phenylpyruvate tautomerase MIF-related protein [Actinobacillus equuli]|uniref:phenylpyruvate tautomerase MIF-related protein n=1 Tax=Actinobacillus equuli TaxID=718 RepID=UPI002443142C|nr:phenylpyruvate tautomerase MIF-related protein [Actinobacillus equuli]WGE65683.1 phenylpyruvate tautomerase MIF-related protein [Actinobacillus equuli subsp. equuli]WGE79637.1 phenylpyruvate tautomerase MIF-related protein [Actinobacillus equuli subsp. equuli]
MPFLFLKTNVAISPEQEVKLKTAFGKAIALVPNKSEAVLMMELQDNARMWLRGGQPPMAFIKLSLFANPQHLGYPELTAMLTQQVAEILPIPPENVYLQFDDIQAWGVNGFYLE